MLDALELTNRSSELHPDLGVLGGGRHAPLRDADRLGGDEHRGEPAGRARLEPVEETVGGDEDLVDGHLGDAAGRVDAGELLHVGVVGVERAPDVASRDADRDDEDVGQMGAEHRAKGSAHPETVGGLVAEEGAVGVEGRGPDALAGGQPGEQGLGQRFAAAGLDQGTSQDGREHGAGCDGSPELFEDHDELGQAEAGTAVGVVDVESEPALVRELVPERGAGLGVGVEQRPRDARGAVALAPAPHGVVERKMVLGDTDRHPVILGTG